MLAAGTRPGNAHRRGFVLQADPPLADFAGGGRRLE